MDNESKMDSNIENESGESVDTDNNTASEVDSNSEDKDYKTLYENQRIRAEKAEARLKEKSPVSTDEKPTQKNTETATPKNSLTREEAILFAKGLNEDEVEFAAKVAQIEGIKLTEAVNNEIFTTWKGKREAEEKRKNAQLGASRGSGSQKKTKSITDRGLTRDEHKELWKQTRS